MQCLQQSLDFSYATQRLASRQPGKMEKDLKQLQGTWNIISLDMGGRTLSATSLAGSSITVKGKRFTTIGMGASYEGILSINESTSPKTLDLKFTTGPEKGNTNLGIYELDAAHWRICLSTAAPIRPLDFAAIQGSGIVVEVLQRGAKATATPDNNLEPFDFANLSLEPAAEMQGEWSMVSGSLDGYPLDKNFIKMGKRVVEGNEMTVRFGRDIYSKAKYNVNRSKTPVAIDLYNTAGSNAGKLQYGIYELAGKLLRLSIAAPGRERPADFSSTQGDGRTVVTWTPASS